MRSWTIGIMVIVLISTPLYQASAEDDIMINEVELNPKGYDKYTDVEEWVELYNAGNEPVDVSGWTLSSTSGRAVVFAIQSGIIIPADGYIKFGSGSQWLDNSGEVVVLRDLDGIIVDQVGPFDDDTGTNSWQRSPDGSSNWVFRAPTPEAPNGGEVTNQTEVQQGTSLTLDPPRSSVKLGDVVTFTGQLLTVDSEAIEGVTIWIKDNDPLATDDVLGTGKTNTNGEFAIEWIVEYDPDDTVNGYAVFEGDSSYGRSRSSEYTIIIFSELVPSSKLPILVLERPPEQVAAGDVIKFRGKLTEPNGRGIPGIKIIIKEDPLGADIALASGSTDNRGEFSIRWGAKLGKDNNEDDGSESLVVYAIFKGHSRFEKAESDRFTITIPFETTPSETTPSETTPAVTTPLETIPIETLPTDTLLDLEVSPRKVLPGDQVIFEGRLVNLDREPISDATVEIMVVRTLQDDTLTTVVTDLDGSFRTLSSIQSSDQDMVVVYAQYQDGKVTAKSLYRQFAVVQSLPEYNIAELLICNIRQDEPFLIEEEGDTNQAKGLRGEVGILLRTKSQDVDVGQSLSVPFKADPGKLIINIVKENGDVATLAVVGDTPLNASPSIDGLTEVSSHFSVVLTPTGSASIEPTKLDGVNGVSLM